jgi:dihydroorotase (multifunctional complex type)
VWDEARPVVAEIEAIQRAILFCEHYGTKLHIVHVTAREALPIIAAARARGLRITAETCPHYLFLDSSQANVIGTLSRMNPPIRSKEDAEALWAGLLDGRLDSIATDHAPHTREEKVKPSIWDVQSGFPGVETYLPLFLTAVNQNRMGLPQFVRLACENPARIFGLFPKKGAIRVGSDADLVLVDLEKEGKIEAAALHNKSKLSPYDGWKVKGLPAMTLVRGHVVMRDGEPVGPPRGRVIRPDPTAP